MAKIQLSKQETFSQNPFLEKAIQQITNSTKTKYRWIRGNQVVQNYIENSTGEIIAHAAFLEHVELDEEKFAKLYLSQLGVFFDLPKPAINVFTYILNNLPPKADRIFIVMKDVLIHTGYSQENSVHSGLAVLCSKGFLARSEAHYMYYINPLIFFNGDRVTFAKTYVRKRKANTENPNQLSIPFTDLDNDFSNENIGK
jgi:hypothetical protein